MKLILFLTRIRLLDDDGTLSFTSLYLYFGVLNLVLRPATVGGLVLFALILCHANLKRFSRHKGATRDQKIKIEREVQFLREANELEVLTSKVQELDTELQKVVQATNLSRLGR